MSLTPSTAFPLLWAQLRSDVPLIDGWNRWYDDEQPPLEVSDEDQLAYRRLIDLASENWAGMIVDAPADRLRITGMRFDGQVDDGTSGVGPWAIWQASGMDSKSDLVVLDALVSGRASVMVTTDPSSPVGVRITPEDPRQTIVLYDPGRWVPGGRRAAALKTWVDAEGYGLAEVMTPGRIMQGRSKQPAPDAMGTSTWHHIGGWDFDSEQPGPADVPVVEVVANARTGRRGRSEMAPHHKALQAINLLGFNLLFASEFAAYRQRWVTGLELELDEAGEPKKPFKSGLNRLFVGEEPETKFGEFSESDLSNYIKAIEYKVGALAARSKTPAHYVATSINNISADAIRALESGLVAKVERHQRAFSDPFEDVMRLALSVRGDEGAAKDFTAEILWADPRTHTDGQLADSLVKKKSIGYTDEILQSMDGASPQLIAENRAIKRREALLSQVMAPAAPPPTADVGT